MARKKNCNLTRSDNNNNLFSLRNRGKLQREITRKNRNQIARFFDQFAEFFLLIFYLDLVSTLTAIRSEWKWEWSYKCIYIYWFQEILVSMFHLEFGKNTSQNSIWNISLLLFHWNSGKLNNCCSWSVWAISLKHSQCTSCCPSGRLISQNKCSILCEKYDEDSFGGSATRNCGILHANNFCNCFPLKDLIRQI